MSLSSSGRQGEILVEQRNGGWVHRHAFRYRYEIDAEMTLLNELWDLVMARKNHLLPCAKATGWTNTNAGRTELAKVTIEYYNKLPRGVPSWRRSSDQVTGDSPRTP